MKWPTSALRRAGLVLATAAALTGCHRDMRDQPRYTAYEPSDFFGDRRSARTPVEGTVARGELFDDVLLYTGRTEGGAFSPLFPFRVDHAVLKRGQERYNIHCTPCHDYTGSGNGMIVQRGFRRPPSFHDQRLREAAPGYIFDVITNGFGSMYGYKSQIRPEDRWAIAAYMKALQLSQRADLALVPAADRPLLDAPESAGPGHDGSGHAPGHGSPGHAAPETDAGHGKGGH